MQKAGLIIGFILLIALCIKDPSLFPYFIAGTVTGIILSHLRRRK